MTDLREAAQRYLDWHTLDVNGWQAKYPGKRWVEVNFHAEIVTPLVEALAARDVPHSPTPTEEAARA